MPSLAKLSLRDAYNKGITHFARLPLSTVISRPQLGKVYEHVCSDPVAVSVPRQSFLPPSRLHINLGNLSLGNPERVDAAIKYIHSLDMETILKEITAGMSHKSSDQTFLPRPPDLRVNIRGFKIKGSNLSLDNRIDLWAPVIDNRGILTPFCNAIRRSLARVEFLTANLEDRSAADQILEPSVNIISTRWLSSNADNINPTLVAAGVKRKMRPRFDATELYPKYRELTWASDVQLEKLSICRLGLRDIYKEGRLVGQGYKEIASVQLPGAPSVSSEPLLEGETFEPPHGKSGRGNRSTILARSL